MAQQKVDGILLKKMILSATDILNNNKKNVDSLNVFPVPDGDTGTNMSLTLLSAVKELKDKNSDDISDISDIVARGALKGARGNSGVILSQLFRGFSRSVKDFSEINTMQFAEALKMGADTAYKAVMKPTEGTILTVARQSADAAVSAARSNMDISDLMDIIIKTAEVSLSKTPELLPVLKQAGVVDSGGKGLVYIYCGYKRALEGNEINDFEESQNEKEAVPEIPNTVDLGDIKYGYCTEFIIQNLHKFVKEPEIDEFRKQLEKIGDSMFAVSDGQIVKVHVHTNAPGDVLQYALKLGELSKIKIDNMREQHRHILDNEIDEEKSPADVSPIPPKQFGIVAVAIGDGITKIFNDLMVDQIIQGGQTMNPSIEDIVKAVNNVPSDNVFVFPNNSNIILAAEQAKALTKKRISVIPTKTIPQGIASVLAFNPDMSFEQNEQKMKEAISRVRTGQVTYAVRDSAIDGQTIHKGDIIGIDEGKITKIGQKIQDVSLDLLKSLVSDDEIVTAFYGDSVTETEAQDLVNKFEEMFPDCEIELHNGGQPIYYYIFSVE